MVEWNIAELLLFLIYTLRDNEMDCVKGNQSQAA